MKDATPDFLRDCTRAANCELGTLVGYKIIALYEPAEGGETWATWNGCESPMKLLGGELASIIGGEVIDLSEAGEDAE